MKNLKKAKTKTAVKVGSKSPAAAVRLAAATKKKIGANKAGMTGMKAATVGAKKHTIIGLGELLWDVFPQRKELGGAPANFAYMTSLLGDEGVVASRVGRDRLGNSAARRLAKLGLSQEVLQLEPCR
jgi:hypothetical protein